MKRRYTIFVLFLVQMLAAFEVGGLISIGSYVIEVFGSEASKVMYLNIGAYVIGFFAPFLGNFADNKGKKKLLLIVIFLFIIGSGFVVYSKTLIQFIVARALTGFFVYNVNATILSYMGDVISFENRGKVFGIIRVAFACGVILSPIYTTKITINYGIDTLYKLYVLYAVILFIMLLFITEVKGKDTGNKIKLEYIISIIKDKLAVNFMVIQSLIALMGVLVFGYFSVYITNELKESISISGYAFTIGGLGTFLASFINIVILDKIDRLKYIKISFVLPILTSIVLSFLKVPLIYVGLFLFSFTYDNIFPVFQLLSSEVVPNRKATFLLILAGILSITNLTVVFIGKVLYELGGYRLMTISASLALVVATTILIVTINRNKERFIK